MLRACLAVAFAGTSSAFAAPPAPPARVLFIGNSLTYANDLPGMVRALVDSSGAGPIDIHSVTAPNFSLRDHLQDGSAVAQIRIRRPDVVVLQQGPSSLDASRGDLLAAAADFAAEIREAGGRPALYAVWPDRSRAAFFERVSDSYRLAAERVDGLYLPAGEAWLAAWRRDSTLALYDGDDFHPSVMGTYVAALVIYGRLTGRTPVGLPARLRTPAGVEVEIPPAAARLLQDAAAEVNARWPT
jgi:pimeloyl-ACP methyl ester carboxylesterase